MSTRSDLTIKAVSIVNVNVGLELLLDKDVIESSRSSRFWGWA